MFQAIDYNDVQCEDMEILEGLNPEQLAAVNHNDGPMLVVAGAGTGKTQVITRRIARLIYEEKAKPEQILALTFTEKAAQEMSDRLHELIGWKSFQVPVMTFNAFGAELLGRFASHIGRSTRGGLVNTSQKTLLLSRHLAALDLKYYVNVPDKIEFCEKMVGYIERLQNAGVDVNKYTEYVEKLVPGEEWHPADIAEQVDLAKIYDLYESVKRLTGTFDYNDQLSIPLDILSGHENLALRLRREYKYVLVDEYQDTSPVQDRLLRSFMPSGGNIFAVGDDDQAIYGFRGSDIKNILSFKEHFGAVKAEALVRNYRSGQEILDASYRLICHNNPHRLESMLSLDKRLLAQTDSAKVEYHEYSSPSREYDGVVASVVRDTEGGKDPATIAVLARSNAVLKKMAALLKQKGVPYRISTSVNIFEKREVINLWYLLEWIGNRSSEEAIGHVMMGPFVGWSASDYREVLVRAKNDLSDVETALRALAADGLETAVALVGKLDVWRTWSADHPVSQLAYKLVFEEGLAERLVARAAEDGGVVKIFEDLHLLLTQMLDYETVSADPTLAGYLTNYLKQPEIESRENLGGAEGVNLLTVHASKGLEFDTVYVMGCTARAWSDRNGGSLEIPAELIPAGDLAPEHEQRRLMYVAATRAKRRLELSAASLTAAGTRQSVTPMLAEMLDAETLSSGKTADVGADLDQTVSKLHRFYRNEVGGEELKLPFVTADGWIELGVGAAELYTRCPYEFYLQHVLKIQEPFGVQLSFGSAIHLVVQAFYEAKKRQEAMTLNELTARLNEVWTDKGYDSKHDADAARARALSTVTDFYARESVIDREVVAIEMKTVLELPDIKLRLKGRIDACFMTGEGPEIRDFKTGMKKDVETIEKAAKDSFQLRTYALAYKQMTDIDVALVTLDFLVTGVEGSARFTATILKNHQSKLVKIAEGIRAGQFEPAKKDSFHQCPAFRFYGEPDEGDAGE